MYKQKLISAKECGITEHRTKCHPSSKNWINNKQMKYFKIKKKNETFRTLGNKLYHFSAIESHSIPVTSPLACSSSYSESNVKSMNHMNIERWIK